MVNDWTVGTKMKRRTTIATDHTARRLRESFLTAAAVAANGCSVAMVDLSNKDMQGVIKI